MFLDNTIIVLSLLFYSVTSLAQSTELKYSYSKIDTFSRSNSEKDKVIFWQVDSLDELRRSGYYENDELLVLQYEDNSGNGGYEFYDRNKNRVLKRYEIGDKTFELYYVFDTSDRLSFVLPPQLIKSYSDGNPLKTCIDQFAYQYRYDSLDRMTAKKIPGSGGWFFMLYDNLNRLILTQSPGQKKNEKWSFTKFDSLDRPLIMGEIVSGLNISQMRERVYNMTILNEKTDPYSATGYTSITFPEYQLSEVEIINYYNDQSFLSYDCWKGPNSYGFKEINKNQVKHSYKKAEWRKILGTNEFLKSVKYFNEDNQLVQSIEDNNLGGHDHIINDYYSHGLIKASIHSHYGYDTIRIEKYYMHLRDRARIKISVDGDTYKELTYKYNDTYKISEITLDDEMSIHYRYDPLNRLIEQKYVSNENQVTLSYEYTEVNFMNQIRGQSSISRLIGSFNTKQLNHRYENIYTYDSRNHIQTAIISHWGDEKFDRNEEFSYDFNGNITNIIRRSNNILIDDLSLIYNGNRVRRIDDKGKAKKGFTDKQLKKDDYIYDEEGNITIDANRGLMYQYNSLNVPYRIKKNGYLIEFKYLKDLTLLTRKEIQQNGRVIENEYFNGVEYENKKLKYIHFEGGLLNWQNGNIKYNYFLEDNTGKIRAIISENGDVSSFRNYGPFDMMYELISSSDNSIVKYSEARGKVDLSSNHEIMFMFRNYLPIIGRFLSINPLSELDLWYSPYQYGHNNAITNTSKLGLEIDDVEN